MISKKHFDRKERLTKEILKETKKNGKKENGKQIKAEKKNNRWGEKKTCIRNKLIDNVLKK